MKIIYFILVILFYISIGFASGQCPGSPTYSPESCESESNLIDDDFISDCPNCFTDGLGQASPCFLQSVDSYEVTGTDFRYVLIFDDEFTGDAIDLSKWNTAIQTGNRGSGNAYDMGVFQFDHSGVELIDNYLNTPIYEWPIDWDHSQPKQYYNYTSNSLNSEYQFPMFNNTTYSISIPNFLDEDDPFIIYPYNYGIYQLTATLPQVQYINNTHSPYAASAQGLPPGCSAVDRSIDVAYWMWGVSEVGSEYGEIDGFEFAGSPYQDMQSVHYPSQGCACTIVPEPNNTNFGDGNQRTFYTMYTPDEIDWWAAGILTQSVTKFYGEDDDLFTDSYYPIYQPVISSDEDNDYIYQNSNFPLNIPMWLVLGTGIFSTANPAAFPVNFKIQSVKYWVAGNCESSTNVTKTDIHNSNTLQFNAYTGTTVTIDGITNGAITTDDIPYARVETYSNNKGFCHGNLEAIATNNIQIKGSFSSAGYLVLKTDANMCNEYPGPYPYDDTKLSRSPIRHQVKDSSTSKNKETKQDSLQLQIKNSITKGQFLVSLSNVSTNEQNQTAMVVVYNMVGKLVFSGEMQVVDGNTLPINLSAYANGVYLVLVKTNDTILRKSIIVEK